MTDHSYQWIDSDQALVHCCQQLKQKSVLAFDTEFMRSTTFYPKAALFQVCDGDETYLIDPLAISAFEPLVEVLTDENITKIFHSCSEDLEVFQYFLNCVPQPLVDTQIAAALLNYGSALGYANLVNTLLNIELDKGETRSDWLQRPLQARQIDYAIQDVSYLLQAYHVLMEQLQQQDRIEWLLEECKALVDNAIQVVSLEDYYLKIKSAWKLDPQQLATLKSLCAWRERRARELDLPRNHIVPEKAIVDLARQQPSDAEGLADIEDLHRRKRQQFGQELLNIIAEAKSTKAASSPPPLPRPLTQMQRDLVKVLKSSVEAAAEQYQLPVEVLAKKNDLETLVRSGDEGSYRLPLRLLGWRRGIIGDSLLALTNCDN